MQTGHKITMMTAYDYPTASLVDQAEIDTILVGDSLGMVVLGYSSTVPVTMDEMIHHCKAVCRGTKRAFVIGDMPFMSYQVSIEKAVEKRRPVHQGSRVRGRKTGRGARRWSPLSKPLPPREFLFAPILV